MSKIISISGLDGSGKSTLISDLHNYLQDQGFEVKVLRSRPMGFPLLSAFKHGLKGAELNAAKANHRDKITNNKLKSTVKFLYYYCDYLLGNVWLRFLKRKPRTIIIFDRYYFDYICDQSRFSIKISKSIVENLGRFIYMPEINIYLNTTKEKIYENRIEQSPEQIREASKSYLKLFTDGKEKYNTKFFIVDGLSKDTTKKVVRIFDES
jgi:thymidylate kinase